MDKQFLHENYEVIIETNPQKSAWKPIEDISLASIITEKAEGITVDALQILCNQISWVIPAVCTLDNCTHAGGSAILPILGNSKYTTHFNKKFIMNESEGYCQGEFTNNSSGATIPCTCKFTFKNKKDILAYEQ
jgi:hypothetical protein